MNNRNETSIVATCNQRLQALNKYVTAKTQVSISGAPMKLADLLATYQACLDDRTEVTTSNAAYKAALAARDASDTKRQEVDVGLQSWVATMFGPGSSQALEFGFAPRKVATRSAETVQNAVLLTQATRKARNTMGKKARLKIKGTLVVPTAPAAPANNSVQATPTSAAIAGTSNPAVTAPNGAVNGVTHS